MPFKGSEPKNDLFPVDLQGSDNYISSQVDQGLGPVNHSFNPRHLHFICYCCKMILQTLCCLTQEAKA